MKKQAKSWLNSAYDDLKVIEKIYDDETLTNMIAFHSQQAIEKSLKAILEQYESKVPRIHNLIKLREMVEKYICLEMDKTVLEQVNEVYTDTRYPSDIGLVPTGKPGLDVAQRFYEFANNIKEAIEVKMCT